MPKAGSRFFLEHIGLWSAILAGLLLKATLWATGSVTFNADEAVMGLMARHILQGSLPVFFYGQAYMGALDSYLIALSFTLFGQTVFAIRLVPLALYTGILTTTYILTWRLTRDRFVSGVAAWLIALPTPLFSLYTTVTIGNYVEILLFNNLIFIIVWDIFNGRKQSHWWWLLAGFLGGAGWWGMGLIVVSMVPVACLGLWRFGREMPWPKVGWLVVGFIVGALPWLIATLGAFSGRTIADLSGSFVSEDANTYWYVILFRRFLNLSVFNLTSLFGLRYPWSAEFIVLPLGALATAVYLSAIVWGARLILHRETDDKIRVAIQSLLLGILLLFSLFLGTPFGFDPTGRYMLPLYPVIVMLVALLLKGFRDGEIPGLNEAPLPAAIAIACLLLGYNLVGNLSAINNNPPGLTTQFDLISHIPHEHDDELLNYLRSIGVNRGYTNYWIAFRLAFLTHEEVILLPRLPYKADMSYTYADVRYTPYVEAVHTATDVVFITSNHPILDAEIRRRLRDRNIDFMERQIGPYTVFHDFPYPIRPEDLGTFGDVSGDGASLD